MVNKLFELLEARWLFGDGKYDAIIETKSIVHALINFQDGSSTAHIANASMQLPISYAVMQRVEEQILQPVDLIKEGSLEFRAIDTLRYPVWQIKEALLKNPKKGVIVNAANEAAIKKFIVGKIGFMDIAESIITAFEKFEGEPADVEEVFLLDREVRAFVGE
jgi:1-deoxy-D-xylulose-5-phosphate reductoisomerase